MKRNIAIFNLVLLIILFETTIASSTNHNREIYRSDDFGYMIIDNNNHRVEIYKYLSQDKKTMFNVANCKISNLQENSFVITSEQPTKSDELIMDITTSEKSRPDSLCISVEIPQNITEKYYISVEPIIDKIKNIQFSSNGIAAFKLKKHAFELDNVFSVCVFPKIDPFYNYSSWGDNETLFFIDLRIDNHVDVYNPHLSYLKIDLLNFSDDIFQKWVIVNDMVLINKDQLIWKGIIFSKNDQNYIPNSICDSVRRQRADKCQRPQRV